MFSDIEIGVFIDELEEKLQVIDENLLILEREPANQKVLQEIFRAAHTIKGSAGIMGYEKMASLTHEIESLFDKIRENEVQVDSEMINVLFDALDALNTLKGEVTGEKVDINIDEVLANLKAYLGAASSAPTSPPLTPPAAPPAASDPAQHQWQPLDDVLETVIREAEVKGFVAYQILVQLDAGTQMKSVRAFLIFETLEQMGEIIRSSPAAEELQEGNFDLSFELIILSKEDADQVHNTLMTIAEVSDVQVQLVTTLQSAPEQAETAATTASPAKASDSGPPPVKTVKTVRVDVQKLDNLMNLVGELVIDRTRLNRFAEIFESKYGSDDLAESINEISNHLGQVTGDLQEEIMKARMLPIAQIFNRFPRMVRDTAQKMGKEIDFIVEGKETELDRNVIEVIGDPLIHLIRNSIDHGIESPADREKQGKPRAGKLLLKASYHESHIVITIADDGKGIDPNIIRQKAVDNGLYDYDTAARLSEREVLDLIFAAGFSTAKEVSDLSGRGVGMDVVRTAIEQINGMVEMESKVGQGTTITIRLPLTLAIIRSLMVTLGDQVYALPLANVQETLRIDADEIRQIGTSEAIVVRERILPLLRLSEHFGMGSSQADKLFVVIVASVEKRVAVVVDNLLGEQEIVIKSLGEYLGDIPVLSGATILGDGRVALIIDSRGITQEAGIIDEG